MPHQGREHNPDTASSSGRRRCFLGREDQSGCYLCFFMIQSYYLDTYADCGWELCTFPLVSVYILVTINFSDLFLLCPAICVYSLLGQQIPEDHSLPGK